MKKRILMTVALSFGFFFFSPKASAQLITHDGISMFQEILNTIKQIEAVKKVIKATEETQKIIEKGSKLSKTVERLDTAGDIIYLSLAIGKKINEVERNAKTRYKHVTSSEINSVRTMLNVALIKNKDLPRKIRRLVGGAGLKGSENMNDKERIDLMNSTKKELQDIYSLVTDLDYLMASVSYSRSQTPRLGIFSIVNRKNTDSKIESK